MTIIVNTLHSTGALRQRCLTVLVSGPCMTIIVKTLHSTGDLRQRCLSLWALYDCNSENLTLYMGFETAVSQSLGPV